MVSIIPFPVRTYRGISTSTGGDTTSGLNQRIVSSYFFFGLSFDGCGVVTFFMLSKKSPRFGTGIS